LVGVAGCLVFEVARGDGALEGGLSLGGGAPDVPVTLPEQPPPSSSNAWKLELARIELGSTSGIAGWRDADAQYFACVDIYVGIRVGNLFRL
jgi:hypothetical protein